MKIKFKFLSSALSALLIAGTLSSTVAFADSKDTVVVSLGADLKKEQKTEMLNRFGVTYKQIEAGDVKQIDITNQDIREQLGMDTSKPIPKNSVSISSCYIKVLGKGEGVNVSTHNLTEVTKSMLANAIITSGITDAKVIADAPYEVTGTAALAGVLKGFEKSTGKELPLENKEVARKEISVTKNIGDSIGPDKAASMVSDAKTQVIKDKPKDEQAIKKVIDKTSDNYEVKLTADQEKQLTKLLEDVNKLNLNYNDIKSSLDKLNENMQKSLEKAGVILKENNNLLHKISMKFDSFANWVKGIFGKAAEEIEPAKLDTKKADPSQPKQEGNDASQGDVLDKTTK
ncbi:Uncharacterized protein YpuA, DUF1002 family [Clostridium cavendishii DSM 21758]|uniref:Uncharacterized protein YpuA, DUF1002 family n=1 Tax=Clostridium cavendishii DSM 21758 TaxID=1121302 RepID=A0A1M6T6E3_9CLOT|nr:DUF1002 domain-containing protein [Clostridium cavendishii]SHK52561.1 Uncharacterized protein YpuA, DUF1002 family [Clostridium cavendishii DSM 21758]